MKVSEILDKAADQIERYGWVQDDWYVPGAEWTECKVCAGGGLNAAAGFVPDYDEHVGTEGAVCAAFEVLAMRVHDELAVEAAHGFDFDLPHYVAAVAEWNDNPERTAEEVVRELRAAAASEREAGR